MPLAIFSFVSVNTGFNHHLRYCLPAYPFLYLIAGSVFAKGKTPRWAQILAVIAIFGGAVEGLRVYPYSHAFFNLLVGGAEYGHLHLVGSNLESGQIRKVIDELIEQHPNIRLEDGLIPDHRADDQKFLSQHGGIPQLIEALPDAKQRDWLGSHLSPGWYAIRSESLVAESSRYRYFNTFERDGVFGHTVFLFRLTSREIANWQRRP